MSTGGHYLTIISIAKKVFLLQQTPCTHRLLLSCDVLILVTLTGQLCLLTEGMGREVWR